MIRKIMQLVNPLATYDCDDKCFLPKKITTRPAITKIQEFTYSMFLNGSLNWVLGYAVCLKVLTVYLGTYTIYMCVDESLYTKFLELATYRTFT